MLGSIQYILGGRNKFLVPERGLEREITIGVFIIDQYAERD